MDAASPNSRLTRTARLSVRPLAPDDVQVIESVYGDPETMVTMPWRTLSTRLAARAWLEERLAELDRTPGYFVATDVDGEVVGLCGFQPREVEFVQSALEIGWVIRRPHWGRGYATELTAAVLARAGDRRVYAAIRPSNIASIRVAEKVGLRHERDTADEFGPLRIYVSTR